MKKTYFAPKANAISLQTEDSILAGSDPKAFDQVSNNEQLSNERGWSSSEWSDTEE